MLAGSPALAEQAANTAIAEKSGFLIISIYPDHGVSGTYTRPGRIQINQAGWFFRKRLHGRLARNRPLR